LTEFCNIRKVSAKPGRLVVSQKRYRLSLERVVIAKDMESLAAEEMAEVDHVKAGR